MLASTVGQISSIAGVSSSVTQKIIEIQKQLLMINKHKLEHIAGSQDIIQSNTTCIYCQRRQELYGKQETDKPESGKKRIRTTNEIERSVDKSGKNGCVIVPRSWTGKKVKIILLDGKS